MNSPSSPANSPRIGFGTAMSLTETFVLHFVLFAFCVSPSPVRNDLSKRCRNDVDVSKMFYFRTFLFQNFVERDAQYSCAEIDIVSTALRQIVSQGGAPVRDESREYETRHFESRFIDFGPCCSGGSEISVLAYLLYLLYASTRNSIPYAAPLNLGNQLVFGAFLH